MHPRINWSLILAALVLVAGFYGITTGAAHSAPELGQPIYCFPKDRWAPAPDHDRPCVFRLYEDGSATIRQWDGGIVEADR